MSSRRSTAFFSSAAPLALASLCALALPRVARAQTLLDAGVGLPREPEQIEPLDAGLPARAPESAANAGDPSRAQPDAKPAAPPRPAIVIEESDTKAEPVPLPEGEEKRAIGEYIQSHSEGVHDCYRERVRSKPTLQGRLVVRFQIGPSGRVIGATAEGAALVGPNGKPVLEGVTDLELIRCVVEQVRKWEFDKPASGGKLRAAYPYVFKPIAS